MNRMKGLVVLGALTSLALPQIATATRLPAANEEVAPISATGALQLLFQKYSASTETVTSSKL